MIKPEFKRIAGMHMQEQGELGIVWMAYDKLTDTIHLYDACKFKNEVWPVICEGINARGRWIPMAWQKGQEDFAKQLSERKLRVNYDPVKDIPEMVSRDIDERMRTKRFKVDNRLTEWVDEFKTFYKEDSKVPVGGFPLMTATRIAMADIKKAKRQAAPKMQRKNYPKVAIL